MVSAQLAFALALRGAAALAGAFFFADDAFDDAADFMTILLVESSNT